MLSLPVECVCKYVLTVSQGMDTMTAAAPAQAPMAASQALVGITESIPLNLAIAASQGFNPGSSALKMLASCHGA